MIVGPPLEIPPPVPEDKPARTLFRRLSPPADGHDHRLPLSLQALVIVSFLGLLASGVILFVYIAQTNERISRLEEYIAGRGEYRDQEQARLKEELRSNWCEVLDTLPQAPSLDQLRTKFGCGPGLPRSTGVRAELLHPPEPEARSYSIELDREPSQTRGETRTP